MSQFKSKLVLSPMPDGSQWALHDYLIYQSDLAGEISVPSGFISDLASIPKIFWNVLPPFGLYSAAAVIHDWLYFSATGTEAQANAVLREAMMLLGCDDKTVSEIYTAVSAFGAGAWQRNAILKRAGYTRMSTGPDNFPYAGLPDLPKVAP